MDGSARGVRVARGGVFLWQLAVFGILKGVGGGLVLGTAANHGGDEVIITSMVFKKMIKANNGETAVVLNR